MGKPGRKPGGKNKVKNTSKIIKNMEEKEEFSKNHSDEFNKAHGERIKNNVEDGENITGI